MVVSFYFLCTVFTLPLNLLFGFFDLFFFNHLDVFACTEALLLHAGFLQLWWAGATLRCGVCTSHCCGFSGCRAWVLGYKGSTWGAWAELRQGMWDLPRPGLEPVSPALVGGFLSTAPPGKPWILQSYSLPPGHWTQESSGLFSLFPLPVCIVDNSPQAAQDPSYRWVQTHEATLPTDASPWMSPGTSHLACPSCLKTTFRPTRPRVEVSVLTDHAAACPLPSTQQNRGSDPSFPSLPPQCRIYHHLLPLLTSGQLLNLSSFPHPITRALILGTTVSGLV